MHPVFVEESNNEEKSRICRSILADLPLWFGIPESNEEYIRGVKTNKFIKIVIEESIVGFVSLKENNKYVVEIYVMGVKKDLHGKGIGKLLIEEIERYSCENNYKYIEVKTLDESRESEEYGRTRLFYEKCGFLPIDVLLNEWGAENPCLVMLKEVKKENRPAIAST